LCAIAHWGGRSRIPATLALESRGRSIPACAGYDDGESSAGEVKVQIF
jgi:hypothetical protein